MKLVVLFFALVYFSVFSVQASAADSTATVVGKISREAFVSADGAGLNFGIRSDRGKELLACKISPHLAEVDFLKCILVDDENIVVYGRFSSNLFFVVDSMTVDGKKYKYSR